MIRTLDYLDAPHGVAAYEMIEADLERALESGAKTIVIEPARLGEATAKWIAVGDYLHRTAVFSALGSLTTATVCPDRPLIYMPLATAGFLSSFLYSTTWQRDPAINYRVERRLDADPAIENLVDTSGSPLPVLLVRRKSWTQESDSKCASGLKKLMGNAVDMFHNVVTLIAVVWSSWKLYQLFEGTVATAVTAASA